MRTIFCFFVLALGFTSKLAAADLRYFEDAGLQAVQFVDPKEGWAVGDEGVVWHTIDAGKTWERQPTGTRGSLRGVCFLNPYLGWVVGREELPHGQGSAGILLFTRDGGLKWQRLLPNSLPGLNGVRFADPKTGYVFGDGSDAFPTGVFKTADGGKTWEPVPGPRSTSWNAGDFHGGDTLLLAGAWSSLATLSPEGFGKAAEVDSLGGRSIRGLYRTEPRALAVGQGGLVLTSTTGGGRWGFANLGLATEVVASLDWHALHAAGSQVWVVGRPGSVFLHSTDHGATWKLRKTGHSLPLNGVFFFDERRGWAVGEAGTILHTTDGGTSWQVQRQGGTRAALLLVHASGRKLPLETLALYGAEEGYLAPALQVVACDPVSAATTRASEGLRFAAAVRQAGGLTGEALWQFPVPQHLAQAERKTLLKSWNPMHADRAEQELLRQMVLALRMWRPAVVLTDHPDPQAGDPAGSLVAEALHAALPLAADPKAFPEQLELGLSTWEVRKVYGLWDKDASAQVVVDGTEVKARLAGTARDLAAGPAGLLNETPTILPNRRLFRLLDSKLENAIGQRHFFDGVNLEARDGARRTLDGDDKVDPEIVEAARSRRNLELLAANAEPSQSLALIGPALAKLPEEHAAAAAFAVANQYARRGQWHMARETFLLLADRYPSHPLTADAYRWLIRHNASSEARRRHELGQFVLVSQATFLQVAPPEEKEDKEKKGLKKPPETREVTNGKGALLTNQAEGREWYKGSLEMGKRLAGFGPMFAADPSVLFSLQAARRHLGEFKESQEFCKQFQDHFPKGPWRDAAAAELWLQARTAQAPKPVAVCRRTEAKPFLDGKLEDPCWQNLKPLALAKAVGESVKEYPTQAWFAHDGEFLYLALRCQHPSGKKIDPVKGRKHDADLRAFDRVGILLDLDRDYQTCFHFQVDQRGCVAEDCWGDPTWNPKWFVAVHSTEEAWQIEAAIPLNELTGDRIRLGTAWACNVVRILPGRGVQGFSLPADVEPRPEGMGLLLFQEENRAVRPEPRNP